ncbi:HNH endonuclease [Microbacterium phage Fransoyer]|nr:HNH endonuclease [Microbacterium phage Fransoyer]
MPRPLPGCTRIHPEDISDQAQWPTKYLIDTESGCWIFQGESVNGYGVAKFRGRKQYAHRLFYRLHVGAIGDGLTLDHDLQRGCTSTLCVNPDHLQEVTMEENAMRMQLGRDRTTCKKNLHPWPESRHTTKAGITFCRPCRQAWNRAHKLKLKAA